MNMNTLKTKIKVLKIVMPLAITLLTILTIGCSSDDENDKCEELIAPQCSENQEITKEDNDEGCEVSTCTCPDYAAPACTGLETIEFKKDASGCGRPLCVPAVQMCTPMAQPDCSANQEIETKPDGQGCDVSTCICPEYAAPLCTGTETIEVMKDENDCGKPYCKS